MISKKITLLFLSVTLLFTSCNSDDDNNGNESLGDYENGIIVSNEGNFGQGNASITYTSDDLSIIENNVFSAVNGRALGDVAQSIAFNDDLAYIVLNVSNAIEIVNRYTFESVATIDTGLNNPRHIAFANGKGYVTNWGDGGVATDDYVAVIDATTNTMSSQSITVEEGPEKIVANGNTVYVAHQGGYGQNNVISVINAATDVVSTTITVGDVPNSLRLDSDGDLWVLAGGTPSWTGSETGGKLSKIDSSDYSVTSIDFAGTEHPSFLALENGTLYYYLSGSVYKMDEDDTVLPTSAELTGLSFYGMEVKDNVLYAVDALDYTSNGMLLSYSLSSNEVTNFANTGIIPGGVYFN
ncbi:YncE family protein [Winogradskyella sp. 4-2091]|uniref:YncE family protein n=1 Tax=Winogradskyella sp. 4-2091 TaxID=3381659 RepID=UPI0038911BE5